MKKNICAALLALIGLSTMQLKAQSSSGFSCGTDQMYHKMIAEHPEYLAIEQQLEQETAQFAMQNQAMATVYVIPVVFHIIHNYGPENISDAQVQDAIRIMNEDFRKLNADISLAVAPFAGIAADCEIEFRLATKDPSGNCTNGIDRVVSSETCNGGENAKLNIWDRSKYLNIWSINTFGSASAGAAAYSQFPGSSSATGDGIICLYNYVGSIGTSIPSHAHVLSHETGHYLNLAHPWGNTNAPGVACGNDNVTDTPQTKGWDNCPSTLTSGTDICNVGVQENVQNFMEYSYCDVMFTEGQKTRMRAALTSSTASRNNLWTTANLAATGTSTLATTVCKPIADFKAASPQTCVNGTVAYTDLSYIGHPTSWSWSFPGGTPATSTDSMPTVTYAASGSYNVSLTTSNAAGASSLVTKSNYVSVLNPTLAIPTPSLQGFEDAVYPNANWLIINPDNLTPWKKTTTAKYTGSGSLMVANYNNSKRCAVETFITPIFDFSTSSSDKLTFRLAHALKSSTSDDRLMVYVSTNCGESWAVRYNKGGSSLATTTTQVSSSFVPTATQWRLETLNLASTYINNPNIRLKFEFISSGDGNNIYIDDIMFDGTVGSLELPTPAFDVNVAPNPFNESSVLTISLARNEHIGYRVTDLLGRTVLEAPATLLAAGDHAIPFLINAPAGLYFLEVRSGSSVQTKKLIKN